MTASELTKLTLKICSIYGATAWRQNNTRAVKGRTFNGKKGVPDVIGFTKAAIFIGAEIKAGKDTMSSEQSDFQKDLSKKNGIAIVIRSRADIERLEKLLKR